MPKNIKHSVGVGGTNHSSDVYTVQYLLNCVPKSAGGPMRELAVDGIVGPETMGAIQRFQTAQTHKCDGRIDPGGPALTKLQAFDPYPNQSMPLHAMGAKSMGKRGYAHKAAAQSMVKTIAGAIAVAVAQGYGPAGKSAGKTGGSPFQQGGIGSPLPLGVPEKMAHVVKQAAEAAAKIIESAAKQAAKTPSPGGPIPIPYPTTGLGPGTVAVARAALESAKRTAEMTAKQVGLPVPQGGFNFPNNPGFGSSASAGGMGIGELAHKVAEMASKAAKAAGEGTAKAVKQAGKQVGPVPGFPDIPKLTGIEDVPQKVTEIVHKVSEQTGKALDEATRTAGKLVEKVLDLF
ncbi:MAG: hypothetical protein ABI972_20665 [Acidobacteriota bacterium]